MGSIGTIIAFLKKVVQAIILAFAYFKGKAAERKAQKEAERKEAADAKAIRERMKKESDENLDDILGGGPS